MATEAPTKTRRSTNGALPSTNADIIAFLGREVPEPEMVPLDDIEIDVHRSQVRGSALDEDAVKLYVQYFEQGELPPHPVILYATARGKYEIGHGAHTCTAAFRAGIRELEAYVLTETTPNLRRDVSALANRNNGVHFHIADRYRIAVDMVIVGSWSSPQAARTLGLPADKLAKAVTEQKAENAIDAAEIDTAGMSRTTKLALYSLRNDHDTMREVAELEKASELSGKDVQGLVASLRDATSADERKAILDVERVQRKAEIEASEGGRKRYPVREKYVKALSNLRKLLDDDKKMAELDGEIRGTDDPLLKEFENIAGRLMAVSTELREEK